MANLFLQFFFIGLPFVPGPISKYDFPTKIESASDTSTISTTVATYSWNGERELVETSHISSNDVSMSRYFLDESRYVKERIRYSENLDSVFVTEKYEKQSGRVSKWVGRVETALCFYKAESLDSVYLVYANQEDSEIYSYRFTYDSENRLIQADRKTIVPNNNPSPDKRFDFQYLGADSIFVKTFSTNEMSDTVYKKILVEKGLPTLVLSPSIVNGKEIYRIKRYTYMTPIATINRRMDIGKTSSIAERRIDVLGRKSLYNHEKGSAFSEYFYDAENGKSRRMDGFPGMGNRPETINFSP